MTPLDAGDGVQGSADVSDLACPRCGRPSSGRFYGPCPSCREELRSAFAGRARDVEVAAYEPKVNVTPNAVAQKDD